MIKDANDVELYYWPISNLVEGQNSETITIKIDTPFEGHLKSSDETKVILWARELPSGAFTDITNTSGIAVSELTAGTKSFEIYVEALEPLTEAFVRVPISLVASGNSPADWLG